MRSYLLRCLFLFVYLFFYFIFIINFFWQHKTLCWPFGQYVLCLYLYAIAG